MSEQEKSYGEVLYEFVISGVSPSPSLATWNELPECTRLPYEKEAHAVLREFVERVRDNAQERIANGDYGNVPSPNIQDFSTFDAFNEETSQIEKEAGE